METSACNYGEAGACQFSNPGYNCDGNLEILSDYVPNEFTITQSYPNPFNPQTTISYIIPKYDKLSIKIFDSGESYESHLENAYTHVS